MGTGWHTLPLPSCPAPLPGGAALGVRQSGLSTTLGFVSSPPRAAVAGAPPLFSVSAAGASSGSIPRPIFSPTSGLMEQSLDGKGVCVNPEGGGCHRVSF